MWRCEDNSHSLLSYGPASVGLKILYMVDRVVQYMVRSLGQGHIFIPETAIWQTVMRGLIPFQCSARAWNSLEVKNCYLHFSEWPSGRGSAHSKAGCGALGRGFPHGRKTWPCLTVEKRRLPVPVWQLCHVSSRFLMFPDPGLCFLHLIGQGFSGLPQPAFLPAPTHCEQSTACSKASEGASGWANNSLSGLLLCTSQSVLERQALKAAQGSLYIVRYFLIF